MSAVSLEQIIDELAITLRNQHLTYDLSGEVLAVSVLNIREIIHYGKRAYR